MPITDFLEAYRKELAHPKLTGDAIIEAAQIGHWGGNRAFAPFRFANNVKDPFFAWNRWWQPMGFLLQEAKTEAGLNQQLQMHVPARGSIFWDTVSRMTKTQRVNPIVLDLYRFLQSDPSEPVGDAERYFCTNAEVQVNPDTGEEQVALEWTARNLFNQSVGAYYTADDYPHLVLADAHR